jgi:ATP-dependent RNA helicase RhlE
MICVPRDEKNLDDIERLVEKTIPRLDQPGRPAQAQAQDDAAKPEEKDEAKPRRSRGRGRGRDKAEAPAQTEASAEKETPKNDAAPSKSEPRRERGGRRRGREEDNNVVGMGDHLPSFIALSFDERRAG